MPTTNGSAQKEGCATVLRVLENSVMHICELPFLFIDVNQNA